MDFFFFCRDYNFEEIKILLTNSNNKRDYPVLVSVKKRILKMETMENLYNYKFSRHFKQTEK